MDRRESKRNRKKAGVKFVSLVLLIAMGLLLIAVPPSRSSPQGWSNPVKISYTTSDNNSCQFTLDNEGNPHVVWVGNDIIWHSMRTGAGWTAPVRVSTDSTLNKTPQIAVDSGFVSHVVWSGQSVGGTKLVYYSRSTGDSWMNRPDFPGGSII